MAAKLALLSVVAVFCALESGCALHFTEPALQPLIKEVPKHVDIPILRGRKGSVDIMLVDQATNYLYLADTLMPGIDVFDVSQYPGTFVAHIETQGVPAGLTIVPRLHRLYAGLDDSTVEVFNTEPGTWSLFAQVGSIDTKGVGAADLIGYDPRQNKLYVTNPDDGFVSSVDVDTDAVVSRITGLGTTEQPAFDPDDGMEYIPSADRNSIFKINPVSDTVVKEYPLGLSCQPHGLAINPATDEGLIGCSDKDQQTSLSWDFRTGRQLEAFNQAGAGDQLIFDPRAQHFYFAASDYYPAEIAIFNADPIDYLTSVPTSHGSHDVAFDEANSAIYTFDGKNRQAGLWAFRDPVQGCHGPVAQRFLFSSAGGHLRGCHVLGLPGTTTTTGRR